MEFKDLNGHTLLERSDQLKCWTEHSIQLYGTKIPFKNQALDSLNQMPVADYPDNHLNLSEVVSALRSIKLGKAPGSDGIPPEILNLDITHLTSDIHHMMCLFWEGGMIPQGIKDDQIITLFQNKGS